MKYISVSELYPGISDYEVIDKAKEYDLIILTFDKDYGEIIYQHGLDNPPAVIFFRFKGGDPEIAGHLLVDMIVNRKLEFERKFTVVEKESLRQRNY